MKAYVYCFIAAAFAYWIIQRQEDPEIWYNVCMAINCVCLFILLCLGVFELCGCVM